MANFDLTQALVAVDLTDPNFVNFNSFVSGTPNFWDWLSGTGHRLDLIGGGLTYGPGGHALTGTISAIGFDLGNNSASATELAITGLNIAAATLEDSPDSFWRILDGSDTIVGPLAATVAPGSVSKIFGDGINARAGATGGNDTIDAGDTQISVYGDVYNVGIQLLGAPGIVYNGGNDVIEGRYSTLRTTLVGDAGFVNGSGRLIGGNDTIVTRSSAIDPEAIGDALIVNGIAGNVAELFGGDDTMFAVQVIATTDFGASMIGDVASQGPYAYVICGDDKMYGSNGKDNLTGDVGNNASNVVGGADLLYGYGGDDNLIGEVFNASGTIYGGDDIMYGGDGEDLMFGEFGNGIGTMTLIGGNDKMYGESGIDFMRGQGGNDLLDGGFGADVMEGGIGHDAYYVDDVLDKVTELVGEGSDFIYSSVTYTMSADTERLFLTGTGNINGTGLNGQVDVLTGNTSNNILNGLTGNDIMRGGIGNDTYIVDSTSDVVQEGAAAGTDAVKSTATFTLTANTERLYLVGTAAINGTGVNGGSELLVGNSNANRLNGLTGNDYLTGGLGADVFLFNTALNSATNHDTINDYNVVADTIQLENAIFTLLTATGTLAANLFENTSIAGQSGSEVIVYDKANGDIYYDTNGAGAAGGLVRFADVTNNTALTAADFVVV